MPTGVFEFEGAKVRFFREGIGEPLLIVPGIGGTLEQWVTTAVLLSKDHDVLLFEMPGTGRSESIAGKVDVDCAIRCIHALLEAQHIHAFHAVGYEVGGCIALKLAADSPDCLLSLTLIAMPVDGRHSSRGWRHKLKLLQHFRRLQKTLAIMKHHKIPNILVPLIGFWLKHSQPKFYSNFSTKHDLKDFLHGNSTQVFIDLLQDSLHQDFTRYAFNVQCPSHVIICIHDGLIPRRQAQLLLGAISHSYSTSLPLAHWAHVENPLLLAETIRAFIFSIMRESKTA